MNLDIIENPNVLNYLSLHGKKLIDLGYDIVPIKHLTKFPDGVRNWQKIKSNYLYVQKWTETNEYLGVGIKTGEIVAIDIDVYNTAISDLLVDFCFKNFGKTLIRSGKHPKKMLIYRTSSPAKKLLSNVWTDAKGDANQIEILGDGQQFVAFATHPETLKPYIWENGKSILDVEKNSLPEISVSQCSKLIDFLENICPTDWVLKTKNSKHSKLSKEQSVDGFLLNYKHPKKRDTSEIKKALNMISSDDYWDWLQVGMGLYHQFDGGSEGFRLWDEWSSKSSKYVENACEKKWNTFEVNYNASSPITINTLFFKVSQNVNLEEDFSWRAELAVNDKGKTLKTFENLYIILSNDLKFKEQIVLDEFQAKISFKDDILTDRHLIEIIRELSKNYGLEINKNLCHDVVELIAFDNKTHPVKEYFEGLTWDGVKRVESFWKEYLGEDSSEYCKETARAFFIYAVKRIY